MSYIGSVPTTAAFPFDQFSGDGSTTAFTLTYAPASPTSIIVAISGVVQNPNLYSIIGTTITFSPAPPAGTNNISVLFLGLPSIVGVPNAATVGISQLSATGSPSSTTFLRGDNTWSLVAGFDSGTLMLFQQTAAPTGWTKQTTHDNKALRVVSGTAGSGGSVDFTTAFASGTTGATTLTTTQIPSHTHLINKSTGGVVAGGAGMAAGATNTTATSQATGGGGSHDHSLSLGVLYVDVIIASKD
jgi:microcystin-dependent protein